MVGVYIPFEHSRIAGGGGTNLLDSTRLGCNACSNYELDYVGLNEPRMYNIEGI